MNEDELKALGNKTRKEDRKMRIINQSISILLFLCLYVAINFFRGAYKFLGRETAVIEATIYHTQMEHIGNNYYKQLVQYEFSLDSKIYRGEFWAGKQEGKMAVGELLLVTYAVNNPSINEW